MSLSEIPLTGPQAAVTVHKVQGRINPKYLFALRSAIALNFISANVCFPLGPEAKNKRKRKCSETEEPHEALPTYDIACTSASDIGVEFPVQTCGHYKSLYSLCTKIDAMFMRPCHLR